MAINTWRSVLLGLLLLFDQDSASAYVVKTPPHPRNLPSTGRQRISINSDWRFWRSETNPDGLIYDNRTDTPQGNVTVLKPYILPQANDFITDSAKHYERPSGNPGGKVSYVHNSFDDSAWEKVTLPHDWAQKGPFYVGDPVPVGGDSKSIPLTIRLVGVNS